MRETKVERAHVKSVKAAGGKSYKFTSPGRRNVPDRLDLYGVEAAARALVDANIGSTYPITDHYRRLARIAISHAIQFTETKATGKKPRDGQLREHGRLRRLGFTVNVVDR